jgi:lysozyme
VRLSDRGARLIANFEGFRSCPYQDSGGVWTIGYGSTRGVGPNTKCITRKQALARMKREIDETYGAAVNRLPVKLNQNRFDALTSFVYNLGPGAIDPDTGIGQALRRQHWRQAGDEMLRWNKDDGRVLEGLTRRRRAERKLFLTKPPPPPVRYSDEERRQVRLLKDGGPRQKESSRAWLRGQAADIQRRARVERDGWKQHDRDRRYQGIRRALRRHG